MLLEGVVGWLLLWLVVPSQASDLFPQCATWLHNKTSNIQCHLYPQILWSICLTSCAQYSDDVYPTCSTWASVNECSKNPLFMHIYCPRSCGLAIAYHPILRDRLGIYYDIDPMHVHMFVERIGSVNGNKGQLSSQHSEGFGRLWKASTSSFYTKTYLEEDTNTALSSSNIIAMASVMTKRLTLYTQGSYDIVSYLFEVSYSSDYMTFVGMAETLLYSLRLYDIAVHAIWNQYQQLQQQEIPVTMDMSGKDNKNIQQKRRKRRTSSSASSSAANGDKTSRTVKTSTWKSSPVQQSQTDPASDVNQGQSAGFVPSTANNVSVLLQHLMQQIDVQLFHMEDTIDLAMSNTDLLMRQMIPWMQWIQGVELEIQRLKSLLLLTSSEKHRQKISRTSTGHIHIGDFTLPYIHHILASIFPSCQTLIDHPSMHSQAEDCQDIVPPQPAFPQNNENTHKKVTIPTKQILSNRLEIPLLGIGTWYLTQMNAEPILQDAIEVGYRLIDIFDESQDYFLGPILHNLISTKPTPANNNYNNNNNKKRQHKTGKLKTTTTTVNKVPRNELFLTIRYNNHVSGSAQDAHDTVLRRLQSLQVSYIDLLILDTPFVDLMVQDQIWQVFEKLYDQGVVKSIGLSNFDSYSLQQFLLSSNLKYAPMVLQNKFDIYHQGHQLELSARDVNQIMMEDAAVGVGMDGSGGITRPQRGNLNADGYDDGYADDGYYDDYNGGQPTANQGTTQPSGGVDFKKTIMQLCEQYEIVMMGYSPFSGYPFFAKPIHDPIVQYVSEHHSKRMAKLTKKETRGTATTKPAAPSKAPTLLHKYEAESPIIKSSTTQSTGEDDLNQQHNVLEELLLKINQEDIDAMSPAEYDHYVHQVMNYTNSLQSMPMGEVITSITQYIPLQTSIPKTQLPLEYESEITTPTQILLRYALEKGVVMVTRAMTSTAKEHLDSYTYPADMTDSYNDLSMDYLSPPSTNSDSFTTFESNVGEVTRQKIRQRLLENFHVHFMQPLTNQETKMLDAIQHLTTTPVTPMELYFEETEAV